MTSPSNHFPIIAPFQGTRYNTAKVNVSEVMAPPYDVISVSGQEALYQKSPYNFIRLELGQQFPTDTDRDNRYTRAAIQLKEWKKNEILIQDRSPSFYLYEQTFTLEDGTSFSRRGFFALRRIEELGRHILPHEKTLSGPKADRLALFQACATHLSPIFAVYSDTEGQLARVMKPHFEEKAEVDFIDETNIRQRLWRCVDRELFQKADEILREKKLLIADGHHRYETSIAYEQWLLSQGITLSEDSDGRYVMMYFGDMNDPGLVVLPTHRRLHHWAQFDPASLMSRLNSLAPLQVFSKDHRGDFLKAFQQKREGVYHLSLLLQGTSDFLLWTVSRDVLSKITALRGTTPEMWEMDTVLLHKVIFEELLGMSETEQKDPRYMDFIKSTEEATASRNLEGTNAVFLMNVPSLKALEGVISQGQVLPPKSTFFYPKLLSGLVVHEIDPAKRVTI